MDTFNIDGRSYQYFGMTDDGRRIITSDRTFVLYPDCHHDGALLEELPLVGPEEVCAVTFDEPDLTGLFKEEAKADYQRHLRYWRSVSPEEHAREYGLMPAEFPEELEAAFIKSKKDWLEGFIPRFEEGRRRLLAESFDDYCRGPGRENAWIRHGTPELAEKNGFRDPVFLYIGLLNHGVCERDAIARIGKLRLEARYPDPDGTVIYLRDLKSEPHTPESKGHVNELGNAGDQRDEPSVSSNQDECLGDRAVEGTVVVPDYSISYDGSFIIYFLGERFTAAESGGMKFIAHFFQHPNEQPDALGLYTQVKGLSSSERTGEPSTVPVAGAEKRFGRSSDQATHEQNAKYAAREIASLQEIENRSPSQEVELNDLVDYRDDEESKAGKQIGDLVNDEMCKRQTIKRSINRALKSLQANNLEGSKRIARDRFIEHIRLRLMKSFETAFSYDPEPGVSWH